MAIGTKYETVAAGQTAQVLGTAGAQGDYIERLIIIPATVAGGVVTLLDGSTSIPVYVGGATTAYDRHLFNGRGYRGSIGITR